MRVRDLAVLDRDYMTTPIDEIAKIESVLTMVGKKIVYAAGPFHQSDSMRI
jgi:predicted amidohydrolase YtcJ